MTQNHLQKAFKYNHLSNPMVNEQVDWTDYGSVLGHLFTAYELMVLAELSHSDSISHEQFTRLGSELEKEVDKNFLGNKEEIFSVLDCPQIVYESMAAAISANGDALNYLRNSGHLPRHIVEQSTLHQ